MEPLNYFTDSEICRTCPNTENLKNIYTPTNKKLLESLKLFVDVADEEKTELPKYVCQICETILNALNDFRIKCLEREEDLRKIINLTKIENPEVIIKSEEIILDDLVLKTEIFEDYEIVESQSEGEGILQSDEEIEILKINLYTCLLCQMEFTKYVEFNQHKKSHKKCPDCLKVFAGYCEIIIHQERVHHKEKKYSCKICFKDFKNFTEINLHNRLIHLDCPICKRIFSTYNKMLSHRRNIHSRAEAYRRISQKQPKEFACPNCNTVLKSFAGYTIHMNLTQCQLTVEEFQNISLHQCDLCPMKFKTFSHLKNHKISIHEMEMKHECHICGKRTKMKSNLTSHMKTHGIGIKNP